jgi:hypothetical protein
MGEQMSLKEALKESNGLTKFLGAVQAATKVVSGKPGEAKSRLEALQSELPAALVAECPGESHEGRTSGRIREEMIKTRGLVEELPLLVRGLRAREKELLVEQTRAFGAVRRARAQERFEELPKVFETDEFSLEHENNFRLTAKGYGLRGKAAITIREAPERCASRPMV